MTFREIFKQYWKSSKWFRAAIILACIWTCLMLLYQFVMVFDPFSGQVGIDLKASYLEAAEQFVHRQDMYHEPIEYVEGHYLYSPAFALLFVPCTWIPEQATLIIHILIHIIAYILLFLRWGKIFQELRLEKAFRALVWSLPVWLLFSVFWDDLAYLNIYTLMALLGTLLIEAVLLEKPIHASIWLSLILITKPQWAFAAAVPLLLGRYRFFFKLLLGGAIGYLVMGLITMLASSPAYALSQYASQFEFLARLSQVYPWRGSEAGFLGYNHSVFQTIVFFFGISPLTIQITYAIKLVLLVPLGVIAVRHLLRPVKHPGHTLPQMALELTFLLYLGVFLWLDLVWEVFLSIVIFIYLRTTANRGERILLLVVFLPYALLDAWRLVSYVAGSPLIDDSYFAWDYSNYFPIILLVLLCFNVLLVKKTWPWRSKPQ